MVCPPTFIATRQRCGGACREELGDLWVAFFLTTQPLSEVQMLRATRQLRMYSHFVSLLQLKELHIAFLRCSQFAADFPLGATY